MEDGNSSSAFTEDRWNKNRSIRSKDLKNDIGILSNLLRIH